MGTVRHWQPFWSTHSVHFVCQCWYFNPQWTSVPVINKASSVWMELLSWGKMHSYYVPTYISWFVEGFRRWRGYILASQSNPDLQRSCSLAGHCSLLDRSEQNSTKVFDTLFATSLEGLRLFKGLTARCLQKSFSVKGLKNFSNSEHAILILLRQ
jgi:hypothetical protein